MSLLTNQKILNILFYQICFIPFLLVSGPFFPDLIVVLISIMFVIFTIKENNLNLFKNYYVYFFLIFYILIIISATFSVDKYLSFKSVFFSCFEMNCLIVSICHAATVILIWHPPNVIHV